MEQYGALPVMSEKQNRKQLLVGKFSASSLGGNLVIHMGGSREWDHSVCYREVYDKLHF